MVLESILLSTTMAMTFPATPKCPTASRRTPSSQNCAPSISVVYSESSSWHWYDASDVRDKFSEGMEGEGVRNDETTGLAKLYRMTKQSYSGGSVRQHLLGSICILM